MSIQSDLLRRLAPVEEALSSHPRMKEMFRRCFMDTIETTVQATEEGDTFIITGDIPAMWQRDSTAQVMHYVRYADEESVAHMLEGLIARQTDNTLRDSYANSFNRVESKFKANYDEPLPSDWVWEQKYEVDSLCAPMLLAHLFYERTGRTSFLTEKFHQAMRRTVDQFKLEQRHENSPYRFTRVDCPYHDTLHNEGKGAPVGYTGMTWSGFRPSDDACTYGYLIPANLFAAQELTHIADFARLLNDEALATDALTLSAEIKEGVQRFGVVEREGCGEIYAYETDGLGNYVFMDDSNVPSLLSLPYLGICAADDPLYQRTRKWALSDENPYFYRGKYAEGIGSPHTPEGQIWPIALCIQAMTSTDVDEIAALVTMLMRTDAGTGQMHESFDPDNPAVFTRAWFAWANSMFAQTILYLYDKGLLESVLAKVDCGKLSHRGTVRLETPRLILRRFAPEDAEATYKNWTSDPQVSRFVTWRTHASPKVTRQWIDYLESKYPNPGKYEWAIELKEIGQPIGSISVVHAIDDTVRAAEMGYCLGAKWWHRGYTSEALREVMRFLFEEVNVNRVYARHDVNNPHSGGVMRKCGMQYEGTLRQSARNNCGVIDLAVYGMLADEWKG